MKTCQLCGGEKGSKGRYHTECARELGFLRVRMRDDNIPSRLSRMKRDAEWILKQPCRELNAVSGNAEAIILDVYMRLKQWD